MTRRDHADRGDPRNSVDARRVRRVWSAAALFAAGVLFVAASAGADPLVPPFLASHVPMPCTPDCILCHNDDTGGTANLRNAVKNGQSVPGFGSTLRDDCGFTVEQQDTYASGLATCVAKKIDTDGDGVDDIDELKAGTDPNDPTNSNSICNNGGPTYGCARLSPKGSVDGIASAASGAVLVLGFGLMRRRRSKTYSS